MNAEECDAWGAEIRAFREHLSEEEKAQNTIEKYLRDVRGFARFSGGEITKEAAIAYKNDLLGRGYALRSVNSMLCSVNAFLRFCGQDDSKVKLLKYQREVFCREEKELTRAEFDRLCEAALAGGNRRLCLLLQTLCGTGIRVSELAFVTVEAVKRGAAEVTLKGKTRSIFFVKELRKKLLAFSKERGIISGQIFVTRSGRAMSRTNIWREMKSLCRKAGVDPAKVFPHNLRHLFARVFYALKKDIAKLADLLGHASIETTRLYIVSSGKEHRREMERMKLIC